MTVSVGTRLRAARLAQGIAQADLARQAGISASYLNLIEHDHRRIAGRLLTTLARLLAIAPESLSAETGAALTRRIEAAAAEAGLAVEPAEIMAARFPGWAGLIAAQAARAEVLEARVAALTDRLTHDPQMADTLHDVISAVTAIRSTASILLESDGLDADWQHRFHQNLHQDAVRLAERSAALMAGLEAPGPGTPRSPAEEAEAFLMAHGPHWPDLETGAEPARLVRDLPAPAQAIVMRRLAQYAADARELPLAAFMAQARVCDYAPVALALHFGVGVDVVLRRLAGLPAGEGHPDFGLAVVDGAGAVIWRQPIDNVVLARGGGGCPLWPVFAALSAPGRVVEADLALPGAAVLHAVAIAVPRPWSGMNRVPLAEAVMLLRRGDAADPLPVGPGCRVCPRADCAARREPSLIAAQP